MTPLPLASQIHFSGMSEAGEHFFRIEAQAPTGFDIRNALQVDPVVERSFGDGESGRQLVDINEHPWCWDRVCHVCLRRTTSVAVARKFHYERESRDFFEKLGFTAREAAGAMLTLEEWQSRADPRLWKFILSLVFGERIDLQRFAQDSMSDIEANFGTPFDWVAGACLKPNIFMSHIVLRGLNKLEWSSRCPNDVQKRVRAVAQPCVKAQIKYCTKQRHTGLSAPSARTAAYAPRPDYPSAFGQCERRENHRRGPELRSSPKHSRLKQASATVRWKAASALTGLRAAEHLTRLDEFVHRTDPGKDVGSKGRRTSR